MNTEKTFFPNIKVKEILTESDVQAALKNHTLVPKIAIIKKVYQSSKEHHTQKVEGLFGTTLEDAVVIKFTIVDETNTYFLDPVKAINKKHQIIDYTLGLEANMSGRDFNGYSATGLKLLVHKIEEVSEEK